jgi:hypothetical protein
MYSLVEMFGRDMIRMEEDSRGKLYSLSDEFKRVCDLGLTT